MYIVFFKRGPPCRVCNFLFVHGSKHLRPLQRREEIFRETERLNKTKQKIERKRKERWRGGKQDDNKSSSDFTDAYFINHVNKSW